MCIRDRGQVVVATIMTVVLSVDHRAVDGLQAARWMAALRRQLEHPQVSAGVPVTEPDDQTPSG